MQRSPQHTLCPARTVAAMERTDLLIAFLAFGAAVLSLGAWLWSNLAERQRL